MIVTLWSNVGLIAVEYVIVGYAVVMIGWYVYSMLLFWCGWFVGCLGWE